MEELTSSKSEALRMMAFLQPAVELETPKRPRFSKATRELLAKAGLGTMQRVVGPALLQGLILAAVVAACGILAYQVGWASDQDRNWQASQPKDFVPALVPIFSGDESKEMREALWKNEEPAVQAGIARNRPDPVVVRPSTSHLSDFYRTQSTKKREVVPRSLDAGRMTAAPNISLRTVVGKDGLPFKTSKVEIRRVALLREPTLNSREVRRVVRSHYHQVKNCLERQLKRDPSVSGKLTVAANVGSDGRVSKVNIETPRFQGSFLEECLVKEVRRWTFPNPTRKTCQVKFPLLLIGQ